MNSKRYFQRLYHIFVSRGYEINYIFTIPIEELIEIPRITVPNIRTVLFLQKKFQNGEIIIKSRKGFRKYGRR